MKNFINKFKENFNAASEDETGDIIQTILIIAGMVVLTVIIIGVISKAARSKGTQVSNCINSVNMTSVGSNAASKCK